MTKSIVVVSGLPRSGTSLLMQMLAAGGVELLSDGQRVADVDNPRGYYELEAVKRLGHDAGCILEARGKAVKVISHLLQHLPTGESYKIIFVERDLDEVMRSQTKMAQRLGGAEPSVEVVRRAFAKHLEDFERLVIERGDCELLRVAYADTLAEPKQTAARIASFLAKAGCAGIDENAMAAVVDPSLYRNRGQA